MVSAKNVLTTDSGKNTCEAGKFWLNKLTKLLKTNLFKAFGYSVVLHRKYFSLSFVIEPVVLRVNFIHSCDLATEFCEFFVRNRNEIS